MNQILYPKRVFALETLTDAELIHVAHETLLPCITQSDTKYFVDCFRNVAQTTAEDILTNVWLAYDAMHFDPSHGNDFFELSYCGLSHIVSGAGVKTIPVLPIEEKSSAKLRLFYNDVMGYDVVVYRDLDEAIELINQIKRGV